MARVRIVAALVAAVSLVALLSYFYGRSGTAVDQSALESTRLRLQLVEARAQVLDGRLSLYLVNFGDAGRHFVFAKGPLAAARATLSGRGDTAQVGRLDQASKELDAAQDLASRLSQDAQARAAEAARLLNEVLQSQPR